MYEEEEHTPKSTFCMEVLIWRQVNGIEADRKVRGHTCCAVQGKCHKVNFLPLNTVY